jgi:hypothetical protein
MQLNQFSCPVYKRTVLRIRIAIAGVTTNQQEVLSLEDKIGNCITYFPENALD